MLPIVIGKRTVSKLRNGNVLDPNNTIKIDRSEVKAVVRKIVFSVPFEGMSKKLLED